MYLPELYDIAYTFAYCLGLTIIAELIFGALYGIRNRRDYWLITLVNVITNPWVVFLTHEIAETSDYPLAIIAILEAGAIWCEALYYKRYATAIPHYWRFAIGANLFSIAIGVIVGYIILM